jgi:hypothetical protein
MLGRVNVSQEAKRRLLFGQKYWKPRENVTLPEWNGFANFWLATDSPTGTHIRQSAGINPISRPNGRRRRPAVAVFLTPAGERHRLPWLDEVDIEGGFVRYFGDNKPELERPAEQTPGNRIILDEMDRYSSGDPRDRRAAAPLLFFRNLGSKGGEPLTEFVGFGVVLEAHRLTQLHKGRSFSNYAFDCVLLRGDEDSSGTEYFSIDWLDDRRDADIVDSRADDRSPLSWRRWTLGGATSLEAHGVRRSLVPQNVLPYEEQVPLRDTSLGGALAEVYEHYEGNYKHGFQALASLAVQLVLDTPGMTHYPGWVTPPGPDGGVDFVQRVDLGQGFASTGLVVLGQAKCRKPWPKGSGVTAEDLARVVARLRRGWIGAYVTTSYYTDSAQKELIIDDYPIVLLHGWRLAQATEQLRDTLGLGSVRDLLGWADEAYLRLLGAARPRPADIARELPL